MNLLLSPVLLGVYTLFYLFLAMRIGYMRGSPVICDTDCILVPGQAGPGEEELGF